MGEWKQADPFGFDKPSKDMSYTTDSRGVVHAITRNGTELRHFMRGSQDPFPWEAEGRVIPGSYVGSGHIEIWKDGNLFIIWPTSSGNNKTWYENPLAFPDPSNPSPPPQPRLSVSGGVLSYGDVIRFCGASSRTALLNETEEYPDFASWPNPDYGLAEYEKDLTDSDTNYVRHIGSMDTQFMFYHCMRMRDNGIIVEIEVYDPEIQPLPFVEIGRMGELAELGNVMFDVGNEFKSKESAINEVISLCQQLQAQGCLVGAGAWTGEIGREHSETFHERYKMHNYETHHRHWVESHWKNSLGYEPHKPVFWNEFFNLTNMTLDDIDLLMKQAFQAGCQGVQYYHWFGSPGMLNFKDILEVAGNNI